MSKILNGLKAKASGLLGSARPFVKAVAGAIVPLVSVSVLNGSLDYKAILAAALTAAAVYLSPNRAKTVAPAVKSSAPKAGK